MKRVPAILLLLSAAAAAQAQNAGTFRVFGSNEFVVERFDVGGDPAFSAFRFEDTFYTNRLNVNLDWDQGLGRTLKVRADLRGTNSDYFADDGLVLERFSADYENGALALPLRVSFGDVFADFSRRTLSRFVRGVSIELQSSAGPLDQSIVLVLSNGEPGWRDTFDGAGSDLSLHGISYLLSGREGRASLVANFVDARQGPGVIGAVPVPTAGEREQQIGGLFGEYHLQSGIVAEGELNYLSGNDDDDDASFYVQVARPEADLFEWMVRLEQNGENYRPIGSLGVLANRRLGEARGRLRFGPRSGQLYGRAQLIEDGFEGDALQRDTRLAGLTWESTPLVRRPTFFLRASADVQEIETEDRRIDLRFQNYLLEIADRAGRYDGRYRVALRNQDDDAQPSASRRIVDHNLTLGRSFVGARVNGSLRAGLIYITQSRSAEYDSWSPRVDAQVRYGRHALLLHAGLVEQDFELATVEDLHYDSRQLVYSYSVGNHMVALEWGQEIRDPERSRETDSQRFALRYRLSFDHM